MRKIILNVPLDDYSIQDLIKKIKNGDRILQIFVNAHKINHLNSNPELLRKLDHDHAVFSPDGIWIQWYAKLKKFKTKQRFGGADVIEEFSNASSKEGFKLFFLGSTKTVLNQCIKTIKEKYTDVLIVGESDGFYDDESLVLKQIKESEANILFIALPSPKKELLANKALEKIPNLVYVAGVGGAFSIFSGDSKRAPTWIQKFGLEWIYRIVLEPKRLFLRYWIDGKYLLKLILKDMRS